MPILCRVRDRYRPFCKTAILSLIWVLLTSPLTAMPLMQWVSRPGTSVARWMAGVPNVTIVMIEGLLLVVPPLLGVGLSALALWGIRYSWKPLRGTGYARAGLFLGVISALSALGIFVFGLFAK